MKEWNKTPFAEIIKDSRDGEWGKGESEVGHQLCQVIRGTDFSSLYSSNINLPERWIKDHLVERKKLYPLDIIFEMAGGTANQSTGRSALIKKSFYKSKKSLPLVCASFCRYLRIKKEFSPEFIYYLLKTLYLAGYMAVYNIQHTGVSRFQYTTFKTMTKLDMPPLTVQRKIAAVLSAYDDLIENNNRRIAILEKLAEELYREWFVRLRFPGYEKTKIVKGVPEGWEVRTLGELCFENRKLIKKKDISDETRYVGLEHIAPKTIITKDYGYAADIQSDKLVFNQLDILFGKIRPYLHKVSIAHFNGVCSSDVIVIRVRKPENQAFVYLTISSNSFIDLATTASTGTKMPRADWDFLIKQKIIYPDIELLKQFQKIFDNSLSAIINYQRRNEKLKNSRDRLLSRLMSGKIDVEPLNIQFPPGMKEEA